MKVLVLNSSYDPINFLSERKAITMFLKGKVEVVDYWDDFYYGFNLPATIKLNYYIRWIPQKIAFSKNSMMSRDDFTCQYCGKNIPERLITIDHIVPESKGGRSNWANCVSCCSPCNNKKSNRTPEEVGMKLIKRPLIPRNILYLNFKSLKNKHHSWESYFQG